MGEPSQQQASHGDVDHRVRDVEARFVVAHQPAPARHPPERTLHHPAPGQHLEARLGIAPAHDLKDEIPEHGLVE